MNDYLADLERMANQIARNFASRAPEDAAAGIAEHLQKFWDPSMRRELARAMAAGEIKVSAAVRDAINAAATDEL
jgi:formate dehydrogenase subunit delta